MLEMNHSIDYALTIISCVAFWLVMYIAALCEDKSNSEGGEKKRHGKNINFKNNH